MTYLVNMIILHFTRKTCFLNRNPETKEQANFKGKLLLLV